MVKQIVDSFASGQLLVKLLLGVIAALIALMWKDLGTRIDNIEADVRLTTDRTYTNAERISILEARQGILQRNADILRKSQ